MRDDDSNWFAKWEEQLPSPEELMPLSQTLITPDLAIAFDIRNSNSPNHYQHHQNSPLSLPPAPPSQVQNTPSSQPNSSADFDSDELGGTGGGAGAASGGEEPARTLKRPRLVWTPQLHKRFVDAVGHLGIKNAVPKTIMQIMSVDGLTRENVASHLQKYRLYLKRMQGISNGGGGGGVTGNASMTAAGGDSDLFASTPVPAHFLHPGRPNSEHFLPYVPVAAMHHHHQMAAMVGNHHHHLQQQQQHFRHLGTSPSNGQFDHLFLSRQSQQQVQRMGTSMQISNPVMASYVEDLESPSAATANGTKVLTLFPIGDV
ncbi:hypothetical protein ACH5RR_007006 [Cinchona calisaya]|uniref:HTH myb-type domain-containing protein n=1 Tax=Cinchona calisaya TaxID=153742 RepID=A0ABD3AQN9_9GENT